MEILSNLGLVGFGGIVGIIIQRYLTRSALVSERQYQYQKEELLEYRKRSERLIEKLLLLEGHRGLFYTYIELNYTAYQDKKSKFIDLNNTFDKSIFDNNKEYIATIIFLYFSELSDAWNDCLDNISNISTLSHRVNLSSNQLGETDWNNLLAEFNKLNQAFDNKPLDLANQIKEILVSKEKVLKNQKPKFFIW